MSLDYVLEQGRAAALAMMADACEIRGAGGDPVTDPMSGDVTWPDGPLVYSGPCRVQITAPTPEQADAGEVRRELLAVVVSVPVDSRVYRQGHLVRITRSAHDPALPGRRYRVESVVSKTNATARRLVCEEGVQ